jgi:hypothetical protein
VRIAAALALAVAFALACSAGTYAYLDAQAEVRAAPQRASAPAGDAAHREIVLAHRVAP